MDATAAFGTASEDACVRTRWNVASVHSVAAALASLLILSLSAEALDERSSAIVLTQPVEVAGVAADEQKKDLLRSGSVRMGS